ncbi:MAG: TonB-dependent receptor [Microscillaceae bacterium]|nr:TonB-dependent receptor [Microscillaceae bacterium]
MLLGFRYYQGFTLKQQGDANALASPDFTFLNPNDLENSDFDFPSRNYAFFAENVFNLSPRLSLTPGIRLEHLRTRSEGTYKVESTDMAGNIVGEARFFEQTGVFRSFALLGLGLSYKPSENWEWYGNFSQNYRSVTFSDLRIDNPNYQLDSLIKDERGYNLDLGARGQWSGRLNFDISAFYLRYNDRIGFLVLANQPPLFLDYRFQTNVGDSRHYGIEAFAELETGDWLFGKKSGLKLAWFVNFSWTEAQYINSQNPAIIGKRVENAPRWMLRGGFNLKWKKLLLTGQASSVSEQYTDATNSPRTSTAVGGIIPAYVVADLSAQYQGTWWRASLSVNNVTNARYFTRRAESYPGPGIIPANPRTIYLSLGLVF